MNNEKNYEILTGGVTAGTIIRTVLMVVALINLFLQMLGKNVIPFTNDEIASAITYVYTAVVTIAVWWKNNSFTKNARVCDAVLSVLKYDNMIGSCIVNDIAEKEMKKEPEAHDDTAIYDELSEEYCEACAIDIPEVDDHE